ncbi:putative oxidoreductase [Mycobacteroides abscessus subsp. bolletii 1S-154-0310]|uniref:NADPH:quinone reductase n=2 Tax=Mycobacteroides abscessus TaxID=36809 RepID=A0A829HWP3_9MYCO|nr:NADP-dependent oxidoreductase [Mycobacteroides abscessus]ESV60657.1 zinc-binding dehydrogenase family protein [Mycobacteroides abscessus MAB_082312_2258]ESV62669.1 zinc-binding dehydrogenase family protein [Mycobacteroides abscessus MAB_091912_2446]EHB99215.1 putative oxidoreductase [Mycobacteroides abscessus 47J26]EIU65380.1 putative oxidoreductase [Mycobacteroides abscessus subsp. bolletii 1S-151-0930]EIU69076.1 putative oxidoreductase [Mycobacteroides abscessus subsp. bolletii 1S-152-091
MNMTQAIVATSYGGADVLEFRDITTPGPGPGQVLINVKAAGVNPIDWKLYSGAFGTDPDKLPMRLGLEISGTIAAVGAGVDGLVPGDDVIAAGQIGGYATRVIAAADQVFKKPASLSFNEAAGFLLTGQTAVHLLEATNVTEGDTVLIHGAAGGVGLLATQLAKARGATVIATASAARHDQLRGYGALPVEYGPGLQERVSAIGPVDAALDLVGTDEAADVSLALVADKGRIATIAGFGRAASDGFKALGGGPGADPGTEIRLAARPELIRLAGNGELKVTVDRTYPLSEARQAHEYGQTGHARGKIILLP